MLYRVMKPVRAFGRILSHIRAGRCFRTKEAALRFAAGIACAYVIDDHNICIAAHLRDGRMLQVSANGSVK